MSLLSTLSWWITDGILLDNSTDSSFFLLTPLDDTPYRRMGMSYQVEEIVVGRLRQQNPAQDQAVRLVLTRSTPVSTSHLERT
jgi:hypothetical protein